eukprot:15337388-Ditylum_brightwellii.AAC.1
MPTTTPAGKRKFYCKMHGCNRAHDTKDYFELKWCAKCTKPNTNCDEVDKQKNLRRQKKQKEVKVNALDKFCSLNVESSNEEDKPNKHAPAAADNDGSSTSHLLSDDSDSDI